MAGTIDAVGDGVAGWRRGQRVGVGWHGGHCGYCTSCRRGDFVTCQIAPQIPGITYDGGYAEYMIAPATALALIPDELSAVEAGPLMCAGITTFNALRHSGARPGDAIVFSTATAELTSFLHACRVTQPKHVLAEPTRARAKVTHVRLNCR